MSYGPLGPIAVAIAAVASLTACGSTHTAAPTPSATAIATATPSGFPTIDAPMSDWLIAPGRIGAARVGMTQAQAVATGLFDANVRHREPCAYVTKLEWKGEPNGRSVSTDGKGTIVYMAVSAPFLRTAEGIHIGSSETELKDAYGSKLSPGAHSPYGATYALKNAHDYVNFFLGRDERNRPSTTIQAISVTRGFMDDFTADGC